jgi:hypothetical protein
MRRRSCASRTRTNNRRQPAVADDEEIRGHDLPDVVGEKGAPRLRGRSRRADDVLGDSGLRDVHAKFEQLAVDPWCAAEWILVRDPLDEGAHIVGDRRTTDASATLSPPEEPKPLAMPGEDRFGFHYVNGRSPAAPDTRQPYPQSHRSVRKPTSPRSRPFEHLQLMAQRENLEVQRGARPDHSGDHRQKRNQD